MSNGFYKLSWLQRIGFGSGDLAQNLIYQTISVYLLFFYTNIYGLSPADAATMFLVVRLVDVLWDPLVGTYVDKHNPKLGKYRSYLVLGGIPLTGFAILCFWNGLAPSLLFAYITYVGMSMLYTLINVPYGALNSSLTRDTDAKEMDDVKVSDLWTEFLRNRSLRILAFFFITAFAMMSVWQRSMWSAWYPH